jgi:hypothetical protein
VTAIDVSGLVKRYGDFTALAGVGFEVAEGQVTALLGPMAQARRATDQPGHRAGDERVAADATRPNCARWAAPRIVAAFAARLSGAVDLGTLRTDLAGVVHQALEPGQVHVWLITPAA